MAKTNKPKGEPFESDGQVWYLSELTPGLRRRFAAPLRMRARQNLYDDREFMAEEQYEEALEHLQSRIDAGAYEWGPPLELNGTGPGRAVRAYLLTEEGQLALLKLLLEEEHGELSMQQIISLFSGNPTACAAALRAAMGMPPPLAETPAPATAEPEKPETKTEATATPAPASV